MSLSNTEKKHVVVVGAGISGLAAAKRLVDAGYEVEIHDASNRAGGKIQTVTMPDGQVADVAAEFIDSDQKSLISLCQDLNVPLVETQDKGFLISRYFTAKGRMLTDEQFNNAYLPLSQRIARDKAIIAGQPDGTRAQYLDSISTLQYLQELAKDANTTDDRPWYKRLFFAKPDVVTPEIVNIAAQGFAGEHGRPASQLAALQFVHEASSTAGDFIASDCMYRVEGGTQRLIEALKADLESKGVQFHFGSKAKSIAKQNDGKFNIHFEGATNSARQCDKVILAAQAHTLAAIDGLESLGLPPEDADTLQQCQYTHNTKITIKTKGPIKNDGFFISAAGYQAWNRAPGETVFLIGDDLPVKYKPKELMPFVLADYARAHGSTIDQMFDVTQYRYDGPNVQKPCYASPAPGQTLKLQRMADSFDMLAEQGIGIVGTYIPQHVPGNRACGYMGNGIESANRATHLMMQQEKQSGVTSMVERLNMQNRDMGDGLKR